MSHASEFTASATSTTSPVAKEKYAHPSLFVASIVNVIASGPMGWSTGTWASVAVVMEGVSSVVSSVWSNWLRFSSSTVSQLEAKRTITPNINIGKVVAYRLTKSFVFFMIILLLVNSTSELRFLPRFCAGLKRCREIGLLKPNWNLSSFPTRWFKLSQV